MGSIPIYRWGWAPDHLATRTQLRAEELRPGGHDPVAEIRWRRGQRVALLYDRRRAVPVRPMTPARWRAIGRALLARHTCRICHTLHEHCLPTSTGGLCPDCAAAEEQDAWAAFDIEEGAA